jgi:DNA-directed RNA polymerase subunit RPC12/RpoP
VKDLFGDRPRPGRRVMMHAVDTGNAPGLLEGWRTTAGARFVCARCGRDDGWSFDMTVSEVRRGLPCPDCNGGGGDG